MTFRIAVITAYSGESTEWLEQCQLSVKRQAVDTTHYLIADGVGLPNDYDWSGPVVQLPFQHRDYGDTPRAIGSMLAAGNDFQALCYLDADNWFLPGHLESLIDLQRKEKSDICVSSRWLIDESDRLLGQCYEVDADTFVDTNCYLLMKSSLVIPPFLT